jgi:hypothetical protein
MEFRHHKRVSMCTMDRKEDDQVRAIHELRTTEGRACQNTERK